MGDLRDYYVIGYAPETGTFAETGKTPELHKIDVRVTVEERQPDA